MLKGIIDSYFCPQDNPQECMPCQKDYVKYLLKLINDAPDLTENQLHSQFAATYILWSLHPKDHLEDHLEDHLNVLLCMIINIQLHLKTI